MEVRYPLSIFPLVRLQAQVISHVDALYHQRVAILLDLPYRLRREVALAGANPARLQRAAKRAG